MNDSDKTASLHDRVLKLETYVKVAVAVAAIFGIGGGFGAFLLGRINNRITDAETRVANMTSIVDKKVAESTGLLEKFRSSQEKLIDEHAESEVKKLKIQLEEHASGLKQKIATDRWQRSRDEFPVKRGESKTVDFQVARKGKAVDAEAGPTWTFIAKNAGTYFINASVGAYGTKDDVVGLTLKKNGDSPIYLHQTQFTISNRWITLNGATSLSLDAGDRFNIQVFADEKNTSENVSCGGAGFTWISVAFVGQ